MGQREGPVFGVKPRIDADFPGSTRALTGRCSREYKPTTAMETRRLFLFFAFALSLAISACAGGTQYILLGAAQAPSSAGQLTIDDSDQGSDVSISLQFLSPPRMVADKATEFVIWANLGQGIHKRLGTLTYDEATRTGTLSASAPARPFTLLITAEANNAVAGPSDRIIANKKLPRE